MPAHPLALRLCTACHRSRRQATEPEALAAAAIQSEMSLGRALEARGRDQAWQVCTRTRQQRLAARTGLELES